MDRAKAAQVAAAMINAGYLPIVTILRSGEYQVSTSLDSGIDLALGKQFIDDQGVVGTAQTMDFT